MNARDNLSKEVEDLHPTLTFMTLAFWRMRLLVERLTGTTPLKMVILSTTDREAGIGPGEICRRFDLDFSRVSRLIQSLERDGLLSRERDSQNRRFLHLHLTEKGREHLREQTAVINEEFGERLGSLGGEELEELERMLRVVADGMRWNVAGVRPN